MERVLELIRKDAAPEKVRVDTPTQNLENYFLGVVQRARQAAQETSGAVSGAQVAAYLRGDGAAAPATDKILERLTGPATLPTASAPAPAPEAIVDQRKLDALTRQAEAPAPAKRAEPQPAADLKAADDKLASLLGSKSGDKESGS